MVFWWFSCKTDFGLKIEVRRGFDARTLEHLRG
jgi:hypothetical protein